MTSPISCSVFSNFFYWFLENSSWICQSNFIEWWQNIWICKVFFSFNLDWSWVFNFWINACFWCISNPLSNKYFIFLWKEVWSLTLSHIINPMTLKMITTSFGKDSITTSFTFKPHTFIYIAIFVNHSSLSMWMVVHPHTIIPVSWFVKHCSSTLLLIRIPISSVLSSQFIFRIGNPICSLAMSFIGLPSALIFISMGIILNAETMFFIIKPITNILVWANPFVRFFRTILI